MDPTINVVDDVCRPLAERLWQVYSSDGAGPHLLFPSKRDAVRRISEQESKILLCGLLDDSPWFYSIESPTTQTYQQSGASLLSARTDVTIYQSRAADRILAVELKAGLPPVESFRKDFEKLIREGVNGLWFHTIATANASTIRTLLDRLKTALDAVAHHIVAGDGEITIAVCVLEQRVLLLARLPLDGDLEAGVEAMTEGLKSGWMHGSVEPPQVTSASPSPGSRALPRVRDVDLTGQEKLLIYCPQIADDTLIHFSQKGDSYRLRIFNGRLAGKTAWFQPDAPRASAFFRIYEPQVFVDVREERVNLENSARWKTIIEEHNRRRGVGDSNTP